jgi:hypothetical protein
MARPLDPSGSFQIEQALHGYGDGHRQFACSASLSTQDAQILLALSDVAGSGLQIDEGGYLTGYPLKDARFYALARTWAAPEQRRPGCVWTHTLLVKFADLSLISDMRIFLRVFRRPGPNISPTSYSAPLTLEASHTPSSHMGGDEPFIRRLLTALYAQPSRKIAVSYSGRDVIEDIVVRLWSQQWPYLRESFRFCTLSSIDRSGDSTPFDLQVIPPPLRSRFADVLYANDLAPLRAAWIDGAIDDLDDDGSGLREFMRRSTEDLRCGREAFVALSTLFMLQREFASNSNAIEQAINIINARFNKQAGTRLRSLVLSSVVQQPDLPRPAAWRFITDNFELLDDSLLGVAGVDLGRQLLRTDPDLFVEWASLNSKGAKIVEQTLKSLPISELVVQLDSVPELIHLALELRPELLDDARYWQLNSSFVETSVQGIQDHDHRAIRAMIASGVAGLAEKAALRFGSPFLLPFAVERIESLGIAEPSGTDRIWLSSAFRDANAVAALLSRKRPIALNVLVAVSHVTEPDWVPNALGIDPWLNALRDAGGSVSETGELYLFAFLMSRARGNVSRSPGELMAVVFQRLHDAAAASLLPQNAWQLVASRLPNSVWWPSWDICLRLRAGVIDTFVERELAPLLFCRVASDDDTFRALLDTAALNYKGRRYLRRALRTLEADNTGGVSNYRAMLQDFLSHHYY